MNDEIEILLELKFNKRIGRYFDSYYRETKKGFETMAVRSNHVSIVRSWQYRFKLSERKYSLHKIGNYVYVVRNDAL
jgi:hypothetical protein